MGFPVKIDLEFYRAGLEGMQQPTWIHMDSICSEWVCVWYLTPDHLCQGGTAFWRHREIDRERIPQAEMTEGLAERINRDTHDESRWEMIALAEMRFNRAIIYPTSQFHSQYPRGGFGQPPETGRLVWCSFFSRK